METTTDGTNAASDAGVGELQHADEEQTYDKAPHAFFRWLQSIRSRLQALSSNGAENGGEAQVESASTLLRELTSALEQKHQTWTLTENEASIRNIVEVTLASQHQETPDAPLSSPAVLQKLLDIHHRHTLNAASSALTISAFTAYASLSGLLYHAYHELAPVVDELTLVETDAARDNFIDDWAGMRLGAWRDITGRYLDLGSLKLPTRSQAEAAGVVEEWDALLSASATRERLHDAFIRSSGHITESQHVFALYHQFVLAQYVAQPTSEGLEQIDVLYRSRLRNPHVQIDATRQSYSMFVSRHMSNADYTRIMTETTASVSIAKQVSAMCGPYEESILAAWQASTSPLPTTVWSTWRPYALWATQSHLEKLHRKGDTATSIDFDLACAVFERALSRCGLPPSCHEELVVAQSSTSDREVAKRGKESRTIRSARLEQEEQAVQAEVASSTDAWKRYIAFLLSAKATPTLLVDVCERALKAVPSSGALRGQILRAYSRLRRPSKDIDQIFSDALEFDLLTKDLNSLVELLLARIDVERESAAGVLLLEGQGSSLQEAHAVVVKGADTFMNIFGMISFALEIFDGKGHKDEQLRIESLLSDWCLQGPEGCQSLAEPRWELAVQQQSDNGLAWLLAARYHAALGNFKKARNLYKGALSRKNITASRKVEAAEALLQLEHVAGSAADVEWARSKLESERELQWSEYYTTYQAQATTSQAAQTGQIDVEMADKSEPSGKRKMSDSGADATRETAQILSPTVDKRERRADVSLPRDRENSSVMVDGLYREATEDDIINLFKDCGSIRECVGPRAVGSSGATALVEFVSRDSVTAARSRDGKFVNGSQVQVQLGWQCTLYVTNFPPSHDSDEAIRALFAQYGRIFDVRWPSKKFASNRRFCYVVFCNSSDAQSALQLHDSVIGGDSAESKIQVLISDPNRRKVRSDAFNNDRELFVSGIPRSIAEDELRELLDPGVSDVRFLRTPDGRPRGLAYVDMHTALDAQRVLGQVAEKDGGGYRLKGKLLHVVMVDKTKGHTGNSQQGGPLKADIDRRNRSVQLLGVPSDAQEAIIQQAVQRACGSSSVKRVLWTPGETSNTAVVELNDAVTAGKLTLGGALQYDEEHVLEVRPLDTRGAAVPTLSETAGSPSSDGGGSVPSFAPRQARGGSRGGRRGARGGLGFSKSHTAASTSMDVDQAPAPSKQEHKSQDAFRAMLNGK